MGLDQSQVTQIYNASKNFCCEADMMHSFQDQYLQKPAVVSSNLRMFQSHMYHRKRDNHLPKSMKYEKDYRIIDEVMYNRVSNKIRYG